MARRPKPDKFLDPEKFKDTPYKIVQFRGRQVLLQIDAGLDPVINVSFQVDEDGTFAHAKYNCQDNATGAHIWMNPSAIEHVLGFVFRKVGGDALLEVGQPTAPATGDKPYDFSAEEEFK